MDKYIIQLIEDIEQAILKRWTEYPPHFFQAGIPERFLVKPKGLDEHKAKTDKKEFDESAISPESKKMMESLEFDKTIAEVESYVDGEGPHNMYYHFGFRQQHFPPADQLTDGQLDKLTDAVLRLWAKFNYTAVFPKDAPARIIYPLLCERMKEPTILFNNGNMGIEFCEYDPKTCPFGEYCNHNEIIYNFDEDPKPK